MTTERLIRLPEVERTTGLRRAHIYGLARKGLFPRPLKIGARASAWRATEVTDWVNDRIAIAARVTP